MMDKHHWKKLINPNYLGAYSLDDGNEGYVEITPTILSVKAEAIANTDGKKEDCMIMRFKEARIGKVVMKPMVVNVTNAKTLEKIFKTRYVENWAGRRITIGVEPIKAFGGLYDSLRIRKTLPREQGVAKCLDCGGEVVAAGKMNAAQVVAYGRKRFGADLCASCMKKRDEAKRAKEKGPSSPAEPKQDDSPEQVEPSAQDAPETSSGESEFERALKEESEI